MEYIEMQNGLGEIIVIKENTDGTATGSIEGEVVKTWSSFEKACNACYKAGFRE